MKILFLLNDVDFGGAEVLVRNAAMALAGQGHSVSVGVLMRFLNFRDELERSGVTTFELHMTRGKPVPGAVVNLRRQVRLLGPDVIHAHLFSAILLARIAVAPERAARRQCPRVVATVHSDREPWRRYLAYRATDRLCDLMSFVSASSMQHHECGHALESGSGRLLANGVDTSVFRPDAEARAVTRDQLGATRDQFLWLAVGSFRSEHKDYSALLRALADTGSSSRLIIAGEGPLLEEKRHYAAEIGVADRVRFLGLWSNMPALLAAADGFVMGSRSECMPVALLEAAASGLPCVVTDVGDCGRVVVEGVTGHVVPARSARSLAAAMSGVEEMSAEARSEMGMAARKLVESEFSLEKMLSQWLELYGPTTATA